MMQPVAIREAAEQHRTRVGSRPSAARAAAAARLVAPGTILAPLPADPKQRPRHLQVVEAPALTPAQRRRRARAIFLGVTGLVSAIAFGLVYLHVVLAQRQFALDHLTTQVQQDQATYQRLRLQVAELGSPQHIISTAVGQLGMHQPKSVTFLTPTTLTPTTGVGGSGTNGSSATSSSSRAASYAPAGDADWPQIKSQLAGSP